MRSNVFNKWLQLGGVDTSGKSFTGGLDKNTLEQSTAKEIAEIQATDYIQAGTGNIKYYDPEASEHWELNFKAVMEGFL